ncbi:hypothetical protein J7E96_24365 [Streptomyces sp. ISL-96]|nr:hypothetical protein [Streptomyces sp. ISL-96]
MHGVLWGRCSQSIGPGRLPEGLPRWKMIHPARQRETMAMLRCQVCVGPAKTDAGTLFLETATGYRSGWPPRTAQPPVCLEHAHLAAERCPHLVRNGHVALMVRKSPLYGVIGTPYMYGLDGVQALAGDDAPVPYGDPGLWWFLASQLVRELRDYTVVNLDDLVPAA